ncbi:MAG: hypothetical protein J0I49_31180 [Pseudonocardia sp.]|uniref:hypothetical protein n=1 Tax=Pseudonocardia sp. TaxID=60912 RepID=UPI001AC2C6D3|nr:hypothetical protein [Pseudonocardia sp.]MBN9102529.1 hypothetical protein [Pseudonocardia sp.]
MTDRTDLCRRAHQDVADYIGIPRTTHGQRQRRTISLWACRAGRYLLYADDRLRAWSSALLYGSAAAVSRASLGCQPSGRSA